MDDGKTKPEEPVKRKWEELTMEERVNFLTGALGQLEKRLNDLAADHIKLRNGALAFIGKVGEIEGERKPIIIPIRGKFRGPRLR